VQVEFGRADAEPDDSSDAADSLADEAIPSGGGQ
jgi:hypothetical protein